MINIKTFLPKDQDRSEFTRATLAKSNANLIQATKSVLSQISQQPIKVLSIVFHLEESIDVVRCIDKAMANGQITSLRFVLCSELVNEECTHVDKISYRGIFMRSLAAGPRAFGGLSHLEIQNLALSGDDMAHVLNACNNLNHLCLDSCEYGSECTMEMEHPRLTTLTVRHCVFEVVELRWLPRLTCFTCVFWPTMTNDQPYPVSFGHVPQLSTLVLKTVATIHDHPIQLSQFLSDNVVISELDLDFESHRIWIQPEAPKLVGPMLQNLQLICLRHIHEECDLEWTMFFLEAAPLLQRMHVEVWDHTSCQHREGESQEIIELQEQFYQKKCDYLSWQMPNDLNHHCLKELVILGYQDEDKFTKYIKRVVKAATKLEQVVLFYTGPCRKCNKVSSPSTRFPVTKEDIDQTKKQISEWASSPIEVMLETVTYRFGQ